MKRESIDPEQSIVSQRKDPEAYPELTRVAEEFGRIQILREWASGRSAPLRQAQAANLPTGSLLSTTVNLGLVSNDLEHQDQRPRFLEYVQRFLPRVHLQRREGWDLKGAREDQVHLMAQCMEAWLVADPEAVAQYCAQGFNAHALPDGIKLEEEPKPQMYAALENATRQTQKGPYRRIRDGKELLMRVSQQKARQRCAHCERFFKALAAGIQAA